jgi:hypothetical protein
VTPKEAAHSNVSSCSSTTAGDISVATSFDNSELIAPSTFGTSETSRPESCGYAVLLEDLAERGLLDETLIVWFGEFGRSPKFNQQAGREY